MNDTTYPAPDESEALADALRYFLFDQVEEGKAALLKVRSEALERVYTAGLRLGIEAHALIRQREPLVRRG